MRTGCVVLLASAACSALAASARAHDFTFTETLVVFKTDGTYQIDMTCDLDALLLGVSPSMDSAKVVELVESLEPGDFRARVERLQQLFAKRTRIAFDDREVTPHVTFPQYGAPLIEGADPPTVLGVVARLSGRVPAGRETFRFWASRSFMAVRLTILEQSTLSGIRQVLGTGERSPPYRLGAPPAEQVRDARDTAGRYLVLGFEHIVPKGLDHILFVLGLFLLSTRLRPLLWQITAFTIAHCVTLALSIYGVFSLPAEVVEPLIALSIAYVAIENIFTTELRWWRPALVFGFGLLHGLGFAEVLMAWGLPRDEFVVALVTFNIGVELGQLAVVLAALTAVGWARHRPQYRRWVVIPASSAIALTGLWWAVERTLGAV